MYKSKPINHTADVGFIIEASTINELFKAAAILTFEVMANLKKISPKITKKIKLENSNTENLLFEFIEELIFLKDASYVVFSQFKVKIKKNKEKYILNCEATGEKINPKKHELRTDVKAITLHKFYLKKEKNKYKASIILDI